MEHQGEIILYQPEEAVRLEVRLEDETVWLTQGQIAELFGTKRPAITKHLGNIFHSGELIEKEVCSILELTTPHGAIAGKMQTQQVKIYNLDAILSVGYRVNSLNATHFRRWANAVLKEYLLRGYVVNQRIDRLERKVLEHDQKFELLIKTALPPKEGIFFDGQIFDAYTFATDLIKSAKQSLVVIDNYVDESVLLMLSKRQAGVTATIYTRQITPGLNLDLAKHNNQYAPINIRTYRHAHDRFVIVDNADVYHIGASLKDLGRKLCAFSKINIPAAAILKML